MIHDKSVNYFASLSIYAWSNQGQRVRAKQIEAPTLEYAQAPREARGIHLEKGSKTGSVCSRRAAAELKSHH